jgi:chromosome segregation ATPase
MVIIKQNFEKLYKFNKLNFEKLNKKVDKNQLDTKKNIEKILNKIDSLTSSVLTLNRHIVNLDREFVRLQTITLDNTSRIEKLYQDIDKIDKLINQYITDLAGTSQIQEEDEISFEEEEIKSPKSEKKEKYSKKEKMIIDIFNNKAALITKGVD